MSAIGADIQCDGKKGGLDFIAQQSEAFGFDFQLDLRGELGQRVFTFRKIDVFDRIGQFGSIVFLIQGIQKP